MQGTADSVESRRINCLVVPSVMTYLLFSDDGAAGRKNSITIYNPFDNDVQFSIKTTSPLQFYVRYAKGVVMARQSISIPVNYLGPFNKQISHAKFLVEVSRGSSVMGNRVLVAYIVRTKFSPYLVGLLWITVTLGLLFAGAYAGVLLDFRSVESWGNLGAAYIAGALVALALQLFTRRVEYWNWSDILRKLN